LAQVIILGVFAREDVYFGARWVVPDSGSKTEEAFKLFTNYDGAGASVGGESVSVVVDDDDEVEAFGFVRGLTYFVVLVNKRGDGPVPATVDVSSATQKGTVSFYTFTEKQTLGYSGNTTVASGKFSAKLDPWSATLAVIVA